MSTRIRLDITDTKPIELPLKVIKITPDIKARGPEGPQGDTPTLTDLGITATTTELNYVDGVTGAIQTQLDGKLNLTGGTLTGSLTGTSASFNSSLTLSSTAETNTSGLIFGTDTNLYRSAADTLKTDDKLIVTGNSTSVNDTGFEVLDSGGSSIMQVRNNGRIVMPAAGDMVASAGNWFLQATNASVFIRPTSQSQANALRITGSGGSGTRLFLYDSTGSNQIILEHNGTDALKLDSVFDYTGTMGNSTKTVGTDAPADWVEVKIAGTTYYLPAYAA